MTAPTPPQAARRPTVLSQHGDDRIDDWYWLRERDNPDVLAHLEAENAYTAAMLAPTGALRENIFGEIKARVQETDVSAPVPYGPWEYYTRTYEGKQYARHCRRPRGAQPETGEQVLLDENIAADGLAYFSLGGFAVAPHQGRVAYAVDTTGGERMTLRFRDLDSEHDLGDLIDDVSYGLAWSADSDTCFYVRADEAMRPWQVWRHRVGTAASDDVMVFQEDDERFFVAVHATRSGQFILITSASKTTSEVWYIATAAPTAAPLVVAPRTTDHEYSVEHHRDDVHGDRFLIVTNTGGATNFKLVAAPVSDPGEHSWEDVVAHRDDVRLEDVDAFLDHYVLTERCEGLTRLAVLRASDLERHEIAFPDPVYTVWVGANEEFDTSVLRYGYTSLVAPATDVDYDLEQRTANVVKVQPVGGDYDPSAYTSARIWATQADGERVPLSIVHRRDVPRDGTAPALLYGYGSYEISIDATFRPSRLSLLDRGFVYAIAHVRGGGELGRAWYEGGRLEHKQNSFTDFIGCAEALVAEQYTSPARLVARGGSAGGLLMGAVANLRPDLFAAIVAEVPFVDVVTTMLDDQLPLTITEWDEWGDPRKPDAYAWMKRYSPYDNVVARSYPAILVTAGLNDPRVQYWEPAKWVAKLRMHSTSGKPVILRTELGAGHGGPSGRYEAWREEAMILAFVCDAVGIAAVTATEALVLHTSDGVALEAQYAPPVDDTRGSVVLCHPHPQYGGTMRSIVVSALFEQLPDAGYGCVRFNFRGVEGSAGAHAGGELETEDVRAALDTAARLRLSGPLALAGWSFGADMALSVSDDRLGGWVGIAPPLRFGKAFDAVAHDPRPKHLVLAQHDEFRDPSDVETEVASWTRASTEIVPGASHFFIGRTDRVVAATLNFLASLPRS